MELMHGIKLVCVYHTYEEALAGDVDHTKLARNFFKLECRCSIIFKQCIKYAVPKVKYLVVTS